MKLKVEEIVEIQVIKLNAKLEEIVEKDIE